MNNSVLKRVILLLSIVLFIFSLSACETMKAAVSFKWGKRTECEHHLEAKKDPKGISLNLIYRPMDNEQTINVGLIPS